MIVLFQVQVLGHVTGIKWRRRWASGSDDTDDVDDDDGRDGDVAREDNDNKVVVE